MKTRNLSLLLAVTSTTLSQASDSARLDRVERDVSELSFLVRQLSDRVEKGFSKQHSKPTLPKKPQTATHLVRTGETYWGIARKYGISVSSLCKANPRISAKRLPIGSHINLPGSNNAPVLEEPISAPDRYTVRKGDTLGHIAQRHGISLKQLLASNPRINPRKMQIGHVLLLPSKLRKETPVAPPIESTPPNRPIKEELPPPPKLPVEPPVFAPEPEIPPITVEEGTPPPSLTKEPVKEDNALKAAPNLVDPDATDLVVIDENSRLTDIANRYLTDVATLNRLNNVELAPDQMIKGGSQLYIPRD